MRPESRRTFRAAELLAGDVWDWGVTKVHVTSTEPAGPEERPLARVRIFGTIASGRKVHSWTLDAQEPVIAVRPAR